MRYLLYFGLAIAFVSCSRGMRAPDLPIITNDWQQSVTSFSTVLGQKWTWSVSSLQLSQEPVWEGPGVSPPPLALEAAVDIARRELPRYVAEPEEWAVHRVALQSLCCPKRWFYTVGWQRASKTGDDLEIPVLFSGRTVVLSKDTAAKSGAPQ